MYMDYGAFWLPPFLGESHGNEPVVYVLPVVGAVTRKRDKFVYARVNLIVA